MAHLIVEYKSILALTWKKVTEQRNTHLHREKSFHSTVTLAELKEKEKKYLLLWSYLFLKNGSFRVECVHSMTFEMNTCYCVYYNVMWRVIQQNKKES